MYGKSAVSEASHCLGSNKVKLFVFAI